MRSVGDTDRVLRLRAPRQVLQGIAFVIMALVVLAACGGAPATASATLLSPPAMAMIADPQGDVGLKIGYIDGLAAGVAKDGDAFTFRFTLAEPIPPAPEIPSKWDSLGWSFCLTTEAASAPPQGYPFAPTTAIPCEFIILLRSSGGPLTSELIDRRPLRDGKDAVVTPLDTSIDGATVTVSLPVSALEDPASFTWVWAATLLGQLGTNHFKDVDEIPDSAFMRPAPWPPS